MLPWFLFRCPYSRNLTLPSFSKAMEMEERQTDRTVWAESPPLLFLIFCVTLNQWLSISGSQFPQLINDGSGLNNLTNSPTLFCFSVLFDDKFFQAGYDFYFRKQHEKKLPLIAEVAAGFLGEWRRSGPRDALITGPPFLCVGSLL